MNYKTFYIHCVICLLVQLFITTIYQGLPGGSDGKESACNTGDSGSVPGSGRSPGEGNDNPRQYFCLENPMDRGARAGYCPWGPQELDITEQLNHHFPSS